MLNIIYSEKFVSQFESLDKRTRDLTEKKIGIFTSNHKHPSLKTHKLSGALEGYLSFSIDLKLRIVFEYGEKDTVHFLKIGSHDVYR